MENNTNKIIRETVEKVLYRFLQIDNELGIVRENEYNGNTMISPVVSTEKLVKVHCELMKEVSKDIQMLGDNLVREMS